MVHKASAIDLNRLSDRERRALAPESRLARLEQAVRTQPEALLGVLEFWLGPPAGSGERR